MKTIQKGFTLIELMIVVAIIGILAAIAIPAYQDYIARAQVTEAMSLASGLKTPLAEYFSDNGTMPTTKGVVSDIAGGKYVSIVTLSGAGGGTVTITATFRSTGVSADISGEVFAISTEDGGRNWVCGTSAIPVGTTTVPAKLMPGACK